MKRSAVSGVIALAFTLSMAAADVYEFSPWPPLLAGGSCGETGMHLLNWYVSPYDGSVGPAVSATLTLVADDVDQSEDHHVSMYVAGAWHYLGRLNDMGYNTPDTGYTEPLGCAAGNTLTATVFELDPSWVDQFMEVSVQIAQSGEVQIENWTLTVASYSVATVALDIKPGSDPNSINLCSKGVIPVAVLTTADFDALMVDPETVLLGDPELPGTTAPLKWSWCDVPEVPNPAYDPADPDSEPLMGDGDLDLVLHFSTPQLVADGALGAASLEAVLTGLTVDGGEIAGSDSVRIVPKGPKP